MTKQEAKAALDKVIEKGRIHLYKPIQVAEILYRDRVHKDIDLSKLEDYRVQSRAWRDRVTIELVGRRCTSSARFQDDLFNANAVSVQTFVALGQENRRTDGAVEAYIYNQFTNRHTQLSNALNYCRNANKDTFEVKTFTASFWNEAGLKRSIDKVYEIVVYALFSTLVEALDLQVEITVKDNALPILKEFEDFSQKLMCLDVSKPFHVQDAKVYRVGVTNAADRGLDMYSNWGPAIQIKHLGLDIALAEDIVSSIQSDRVVIVCKQAEKDVITSLLTQIGWRNRIQSIVTEDDLILWYEKALRGKYATILGDKLLNCLVGEIAEEFPSLDTTPEIIQSRHYELVNDEYWCK